jgi:hypothetical protein
MSDWDESPFNDPRQVAMDFDDSPGDDFDSFHKQNPWIWRQFRTAVLEQLNTGDKNVSAAKILSKIMSGTNLHSALIKKYQELFISNHQELEHVFESAAPKETSAKG